MRGTRVGSALALGAWLFFGLAGCAAVQDERASLAAGEVRLATSLQGAFDVGCPAAIIEGLLVPDDRAGTAVRSGPRETQVIWPYGYTAREAQEVVEILDPTGAVVARTGEDVTLTGGMITSDGRWSTCGAPLVR